MRQVSHKAGQQLLHKLYLCVCEIRHEVTVIEAGTHSASPHILWRCSFEAEGGQKDNHVSLRWVGKERN